MASAPERLGFDQNRTVAVALQAHGLFRRRVHGGTSLPAPQNSSRPYERWRGPPGFPPALAASITGVEYAHKFFPQSTNGAFASPQIRPSGTRLWICRPVAEPLSSPQFVSNSGPPSPRRHDRNQSPSIASAKRLQIFQIAEVARAVLALRRESYLALCCINIAGRTPFTNNAPMLRDHRCQPSFFLKRECRAPATASCPNLEIQPADILFGGHFNHRVFPRAVQPL